MNKGYKNIKSKQVKTVEEFNKILKLVREHTPVYYNSHKWGRLNNHSLANYSFIEDNSVNIKVTTKFYNYKLSKNFEPCTFEFRKDGEEKAEVKSAELYATMQKYYRAPDFKDDFKLNLKKTKEGKFELSAAPLLGFKKQYDNTEQYLYVYDLNSAYAAQMINKIPDTTSYQLRTMVHEGEIGFLLAEKLPLVHSGYADVVFKLMESPYKKYIKKYYDIKRNSTGEEKQKAKNQLVVSVGYLQRKNPFIRSYIINSCNEFIERLIDENTVMWNTDALYSLTKRSDLEIGDEIGQFKLEYEGLIRHKGNTYQKVKTGEVSYRGVNKTWFDANFNLLTDPTPKQHNKYELNTETLQLEETQHV